MMVSALAALFLLQALEARNRPIELPSPSATTATAARAVRAPVIDGKDDDEVWRDAPRISAFQEFDPNPGKAPRFATEVRVAYDARNFYVFIRAFDSDPKRILKLLARRDIRTASDQIKIIVDSYHDRRSGYEFAVNPAGVKRDFAISNDGNEDDAWDGVWEAGTSVDSLGWTAEFRIPLSQMRYSQAESNTFGFAVWRDIDRYKERVSWPLFRNDVAGFSSQLGEVQGLAGLAAPRRLEISPYAVTKNVTVAKDRLRQTLDSPPRQASPAGSTSSTGSPPTSRWTAPSTRTSARWSRTPRSSTWAPSRPSSRSGVPSSSREPGCSASASIATR